MNRVEKSKRIHKSAILLAANNYLNEAVVSYWHSVRELMFHVLFLKKISYQSTHEAIRKFIQEFQNDRDLVCDFLTLERIATLAEWDEFFQISSADMIKITGMHFNTFKKLNSYGAN